MTDTRSYANTPQLSNWRKRCLPQLIIGPVILALYAAAFLGVLGGIKSGWPLSLYLIQSAATLVLLIALASRLGSIRRIQDSSRATSHTLAGTPDANAMAMHTQLGTYRRAKLVVWEWDIIADVCTWGDGAAELYEVPEGRMPRRSAEFFSDLHPDERARAKAHSEEALESKGHYEIEYPVERPGGKSIWIREWGDIERDAGGRAIRMIGAIQNVTDQKNTELALRHSEAHLRAIFDSTPDCITLVGPDGRCVSMNRAGLAMLGTKNLREVQEKPLTEFILTEHRDEFIHLFRAAIAGKSGTLVFQVSGLKGRRRWLDTSAVPLRDAQGNVVAMLAVMRDITELRRAETLVTRLGRIVEDSQNEVYVFDAETLRFVQANRSARENLGYSMKELQELTPVNLKPELTIEKFKTLIEPLRNGTRTLIEFDTVQRRKNGSTYDVAVRLQSSGEDSRPMFLAIIEDITERNRIEKLRQESESLLRAAQELAQLACWHWDFGSKQKYTWSRSGASLLGLPFAQLPTDDNAYLAMVDPRDRETVAAAFARSIIEETGLDIEYRIQRSDGAVIWVRELDLVQRDSAGKATRMISTIQDVTVYKHVEDALRQSEARFRSFMDHAPFDMLMKDLDGRYLMVNAGLARAWGRPISEILGRRIRDLSESTGVQQEEAMEHEVICSGRSITRELYFDDLGPDWTQEVRFPIKSDDGDTVAIGGVAIDIGDRKRAERAMVESEARLRAFFDNTPVEMMVKELDGRYAMVNRCAEERWGRTSAEILGRRIAEIPGVEGSEIAETMDREVIETAGVVVREVDYSGRGTEWRHDVKFPIKDDRGNLMSIGCIGIDIGARKIAEIALRDSEAKLHRAQRQARLAYWSEDLTTGEYEWSPGSGLFFRMPDDSLPRTEAAFVAVVHPDDRERVTRLVRQIRDGLKGYDVVYRLLRPDGAVTWVRELGEVERETDGRRVAITGTLQDITEHRALEEQLQQAQKMEAVGQLTGGIAHDFNNLLSIILGNLDLLREEPGMNLSAQKKINTAIKAGMRGANLTHRLLAFARRQVLMPKRTNVTELIRSMQPLLQQPLGPTIITTFRLVDDAWPAEVDQSQLEISVLNLTLNARDAMPGGGQLIVSTSNATITTRHAFAPDSIAPGDYVVISVSDTGCGMSEQVKAHAFDPFFTTKEVGKGTGLGLSMVYGFVMQSGGNVRIQSQIGSGTTVSLYLPRSAGLMPPSYAEEKGVPGIDRRHIVLLVEDEADVRDLVAAYLESLGYSVVSASDGPSALVVLGAHPKIDLLLTDVILPGAMDGVAIAARVRAERPEIKVVYMSGYAPEAEWILGESQILNKPFGKSELAKALSTALDDRRAN